jgi:glycosyltransferase involved in cell wall biosynthesis
MRAVGLVERPDHVCCRYRLRAYTSELQSRGWQVELRPLMSSLLARLYPLREDHTADVVVLQRKLLDAFRLRLLRYNARRLVFDFDDAVLYRDSYAEKGSLCPRRAIRFRRMVEFADAVVAGNEFLAEQAAQFTQRDRVHVVPTCVNPARYPMLAEHRNAESVELVWIGSTSTLRGLVRATPLFEAIGRYVPGLRLKVVCDSFPQFDRLPVVPVFWSEATEAHELARSDIGISWLPDDLWSRGKCGLKVLQYMAAGLPVVTNTVGVHTDMVEHGRSGFLVETKSDWIEAITTLAADPALRRAMGRRGRQIVEERFSIARWAPVVDGILSGGTPRTSSPSEFARDSAVLEPVHAA